MMNSRIRQKVICYLSHNHKLKIFEIFLGKIYTIWYAFNIKKINILNLRFF